MITFLRKIRQNLLLENKTAKYLKYAIGEIVLVMIGILLALQVSNWNEERVIKKNERKILIQLNADFKTNLVELEGIHEALVDNNKKGLKILNHLKTRTGITDSLQFWVEGFSGSNIFNNANTTYKNIENSEKNIISNDSLRLRITLMHEHDFVNVRTRERFFYDDYYPKYKSVLHKYFKAGSNKEKWLTGQFLVINTPRKIDALRKNEDYKNVLVELYNSRLIRIHWLGETLEKLKILIQDIDKEIEDLK